MLLISYEKLYGKRYLIVLDDVWDIDTWDELTRPFPKVVNESRIILTTRQKEVAFHGKCNTDPLNLRLLSSEESWELLEKRAFGKESCPDELLNVGKEIALNCKGIPLVVDLIAGVIAWREKTKFVWLEVRNNLNSFILNSESGSDEDLMPRIVTILYDKEHCGPNNFVLLNSKKKRHSGKHLCSLLITGDEMEDRLSDACRVRDFKLLRMLDLSPSFMLVKDSLLNEIGMLNHLRFLRIGTEVKSPPSSFSNL
ncbi:putative late blight resistance protein -like protein R1A-10 [Capsicum baccatum]|uniref:Late blight resistance protein-like protein R1A-10 n=1 Tax=Capsicum baccatum TaxID=33114 RepID=A0A2G2WHT5_CAPBA|nr:putative late blight resistance protein -like protein R1A-10 [Capsicum baccatum]